MLCRAVSCHAMPCDAVQCRVAIRCRAVRCRAGPCDAASAYGQACGQACGLPDFKKSFRAHMLSRTRARTRRGRCPRITTLRFRPRQSVHFYETVAAARRRRRLPHTSLHSRLARTCSRLRLIRMHMMHISRSHRQQHAALQAVRHTNSAGHARTRTLSDLIR